MAHNTFRNTHHPPGPATLANNVMIDTFGTGHNDDALHAQRRPQNGS